MKVNLNLQDRPRTAAFILAVLTVSLKGILAYVVLHSMKNWRWVWDLQWDLRHAHRHFMEKILQGNIPYYDFGIEYPTGAGLFFWLFSVVFGVGPDEVLMRNYYFVLSFVDVINVFMIYWILREICPRRAFRLSLLYVALPTGLIIGPYRLEFIVTLFVLIAFWLQLRKRCALGSSALAVGAAIKWYPLFIFAALELRRFPFGRATKSVAGFRREVRDYFLNKTWQNIAAFLLVLVLFNLPFIIANLARHGSIDNWRYSYAFHVERELSIDTLLGVWSIWLGYPAIEVYAGYITLVLMAFVLFFRPSLPLAHKGAALCMTALLFNRVYSPQFHLWFIPFLIIAIASEPRARALIITALLVLLEVFNITIFPFLFVHLMDNSWGLVSKTNPFTAIASLLVVGRGMVLFVLICLLLAKKEPEHARGACGGGDLGHGTHAADRGAGP